MQTIKLLFGLCRKSNRAILSTYTVVGKIIYDFSLNIRLGIKTALS